MITENLPYLRKKHKLSQKALSDKLDVPRTTLSGWERGTAEPNIDMLVRIAEAFDIAVDDLIRKRIETEDMEVLRNRDLRVLAISVDDQNKQNIELVDSKAEAGYLENFNDPEFIKELPRLYFPQVPEGTYRAFEVQGDSMLPLEPGTIVICSYVERLEEVRDERTYVVATQDGLVYKRLRRNPGKRSFTAVSDNTVYPPFALPYGEVKEIWQYYAHLAFSDLKASMDVMMEEKISDIQRKVTEIHGKFA